MIKLYFLMETHDFVPVVFAVSDNKKSLYQFLNDTNTNGDVWDENYYPGIMKTIFEEHKKIFENKFFVFRALTNNDTDESISVSEFIRMVECVQNRNKMIGFDDELNYSKLIQNWYNKNIDICLFGDVWVPESLTQNNLLDMFGGIANLVIGKLYEDPITGMVGLIFPGHPMYELCDYFQHDEEID